MNWLTQLRNVREVHTLVAGNHVGIIQAMLDFDYLSGKQSPSVIAIIGVQQKLLRYFWGQNEVLIPAFSTLNDVGMDRLSKANVFVVAQSGRRATEVSQQIITTAPSIICGMIFAEGVPEQHALRLRASANKVGIPILGPASVGLIIPGVLKLGAIGGILPSQIVTATMPSKRGGTAVISTSGGMVNELMTMVGRAGGNVSFAAAVGGERYPIVKPVELVERAMDDVRTTSVVYFGELGGRDEYEIVELLRKNPTKKPILAYIAGTAAEKFESAPQFGHAKAMARDKTETATAKKNALRAVATVADSFSELEELIAALPVSKKMHDDGILMEKVEYLENRQPALFIDRVSSDNGGVVKILGVPLDEFVAGRSLSEIALAMFLGKQPQSKKLVDYFDTCLRLLVDHGPQVSGAVNTMITARAGKDLTASLASGLLTIGPRFGGAINEAAENWLQAVQNQELAGDFVERFASNKQFIAGIGHKKYRTDNPDPRVAMLLDSFDTNGKYLRFAQEVEVITTKKSANLIANIDGVIAALLLDILSTEEGYTEKEIATLFKCEFGNAIFVYSRTVGFVAHYLEQKRIDEGLFRLPDGFVAG